MPRRRPRRGPLALVVRALLLVVAVIALVALGLFAVDSVATPVSLLMLAQQAEGRSTDRIVVPLDAVAPILVATVVSSEDAQFCRNGGVDWNALHAVMDDAGEDGPSRGASTITMQVAKNLFLWPGRSTLRKGLEIAIALGLGQVWTKRHVIEVYLNIAEWGDGTFGIEAAAQRYFDKPASRLDAREAALLATALPNPILRDPSRPGAGQRRLAANLMARVRAAPDVLDCLTQGFRSAR